MRARPTTRPPTAARLLAWIPFALGACAAPEHHEPSFTEVSRAAAARSAETEQLEHGLALAALAPLSLPLPDEAQRHGAEADAFWHAAALAWNAGVREARRSFLQARAGARSAGASEPIRIGGDTVFGDGEREGELSATLDVLGLFGLGVSRAARALADEEARLAFAEYEQRVWNAWIDVDRARVELGTRRRLLAELESVDAEQEPLARRREILAGRGFLPEGLVDAARTIETMFDAERSTLRTEIADAREALALAAGLPVDAPELEARADELIAALTAEEPLDAPPAELLWDTRPEVRAMRVRCAIAEAKLRSVYAERLPELRLGVKSIFSPETVLVGPMFDAALAYPGARDGRIEAALEECSQMREAVEAELLAAIARARTAAEVWHETRRDHDSQKLVLERASAAAWRAARVRFLNDPQAVAEAAAMLAERRKALMLIAERDRALALAALEFRRAAGARSWAVAASAPSAREVQP